MILFCYASAFRRQRHYVFGLSIRPSIRPSVRSLKYPLLTCTWGRWSTRHVRPSVRPSILCLSVYSPSILCPSIRPSVRRGFWAFARECKEGLAWNFTSWCILIIFRISKFMVMVCWFFKFWHYFDLVKRVKFGVSGHYPENSWGECPEILHADVSWPSSELVSLWLQFVDFFNFGAILT